VGAGVYLDGIFRGYSPVTIHGVSGGLHRLTVKKPQWTTYDQTLQVPPGRKSGITVKLYLDPWSGTIAPMPAGGCERYCYAADNGQLVCYKTVCGPYVFYTTQITDGQ
jgi:hypothetical protein